MTGLAIVLAHLVGDYVVQTHWMATEKTKRWLPALLHAVTYTACYLPVTTSWHALLVIGGTHALIDRYRLARFVVWAKNQLAATGYPEDTPAWLAVWLLIIADNVIHLLINTWAVTYR